MIESSEPLDFELEIIHESDEQDEYSDDDEPEEIGVSASSWTRSVVSEESPKESVSMNMKNADGTQMDSSNF